MKNENNAIVILYNGNKTPDYLIQKIAEILITNGICIPELLTIEYKDEDALLSTLVKDSVDKMQPEVKDRICLPTEAIKHAVVYISKRFEASLTGTNNLAMFALELSNAVRNAHQKISFNGIDTNDEILNAVEIISATPTKTVLTSLGKNKYHFSQEVIEIIKHIHKHIQ